MSSRCQQGLGASFGQVPTCPSLNNPKIQQEEREVEDKGDKKRRPEPDVLPANPLPFELDVITYPAPILSHMSLADKK